MSKERTYTEAEIPAKLSELGLDEWYYEGDWIRRKLATHSAGVITDKDFSLARKIEDTVLWRPDADGPLDGPMGKFVFSKSRLGAGA